MLIPEDSPLRKLPLELSRKQILLFDGIRYSAEMAYISYNRLFNQLQNIASQATEPTTGEIATAMLDAWSIVDAVHRFRDLVHLVPGLKQGAWATLLDKRTEDVAELRNCVQHQNKFIDTLISSAGQIWGYLSWAELKDGKYTGKWLMISPGEKYAGDKWLFIGPTVSNIPLPLGRVRLNAFGKQVYLEKSVNAVEDAVNSIVKEIESDSVRLVGSVATERHGSDLVMEGWIEVLVSNS
jgi:hypothetical protein